MKARYLGELLLLAAIWGASFLFMRVAVPAFGVLAMGEVRVLVATAVLLPLVALRGDLGALRRHGPHIAVVGLVNSAIPFVCYGYAALHISAGLASVFNAATPLFSALVAWAWLGERLTRVRVAGLAIGLAGVAGLAWDKIGLRSGTPDLTLAGAVACCLAATACYGFAACYTRRYLQGAPAPALAAGSQGSAALALALPAAWAWPAQAPGALPWAMVLAMGVLSTGLAYVLYFRLIRNIGATNASAVTFLIPVFAVLWGMLFLGETVSPAMVLGCAVILAGTALAMGLWPRSRSG